MAQQPKPPSPHAASRLEKAQKVAREAEKAMADYEAAGRATEAKTQRLKALRLAKEETDRAAAAEREAAAPKKAVKKAAKAKKR